MDSKELKAKKEFSQQLLNSLVGSAEHLLTCQAKGKDLTFDNTDWTLFRIDEITFEKDAPRQEAMENILAAMRVPGVNFIYMIEGNASGVHFYFGIAKDTAAPEKVTTSIKDIGSGILEPSILGNYRGSKIAKLAPEQLEAVRKRLEMRKYAAVVDGVPGITQGKEKKTFQGVDRLVDVMLGDTFVLMILAKPITDNSDQQGIYRELCKLYALLAPLARQNRQEGISEEISETEGTSKNKTESDETREAKSNGTNKTKTKSVSEVENHNTTTRKAENKTNSTSTTTNTRTFTTKSSGGERNSTGSTEEGNEGGAKQSQVINGTEKVDSIGNSVNNSANEEENESTSSSRTVTKANNTSVNQSKSHTTHTNSGATAEHVNKEAQDWMKYLDEVILPRFDYGLGKGLFAVSTCIMADNPKVLLKLGNTVRSIFSGDSGNRVPLNTYNLAGDEEMLARFRKFQLSYGESAQDIPLQDSLTLFAKSHCKLSLKIDSKKIEERLLCGRWMSSAELATMAGVPQKEVVGMKLKEEVEFGLNVAEAKKDEKEDDLITIGKLIQSGVERTIPVKFSKKDMDRHIFVAGVTGGGKTITCKKLLLDTKWPFLVIEPAKTEYRSLKNSLCKDLLVFTLGSETVAPFRLNPFEFLPGENITSRVDMIKATIEASFDMEAAIPQIIEKAIYACYEDKGWDVNTNENSKFTNPFADGVFAFPTLQELVDKCSEVVKTMGFDDRLKNDYIGSIKARLNGLLVGAKGKMLNCRRSMDFDQLLDRQVVLELEEIRSVSEKSLVMGFILTNLLEAIKQRFKANGDKKHHHITLLEEAHRLLSRYEPGDSPNKKHGVETFADMLAEIRKYGESLIIADQIPNKMTPEVLKNTNTKIVHRLFAQDDKDVIGSTMALTEEQRNFLSHLDVGRAIMFTGNWSKAVQVQVDMVSESEEHVDERLLRKGALELYAKNYKRGIIDYSECYKKKPTLNEMEDLLKINSLCEKELETILNESRVTAADLKHINEMADSDLGEKFFNEFLRQYFGNAQVDVNDKLRLLREMVETVNQGHTLDPNLRAMFKAVN